jgi:phosphoribosylanthranilate isomerase
MWVKICANTNIEDALQAVELGADAVGFVFAPSKRQVNAAQVRAITVQMPAGVELVGVFASSDAEEIADAVRASGLTAVQLHGGVDLEFARSLRSLLGEGVEIIHSVHWTVGEDDASEEAVRAQLRQLEPGERVLVDAKLGGVSGGLGVSFDSERAGRVLREFPELRVIVAGGLKPETVAEAVRVLEPHGVDVASGVELSAGKKDFEKLRRFIENARRA